MSKVTIWGAILASIHLTGYAATVHFHAYTGWSPVTIFLAWQIIDFPIGLIAFFAMLHGYWKWIEHSFGDDSFLQILLNPLNLVHGILGMAWWFLIPRFVVSLRRSLSG